MKEENYENRGYFTEEELNDVAPPEQIIKEKSVPMIECIQEIPCNVCLDSCKFGAIKKAHINDPPKIEWEKCCSCLLCVRLCPGLAIFMLSLKDGKAQITIPWEMQYIPTVGETVNVLNRKGEKIGVGTIVQVASPIKNNKTYLITFETDKSLLMKARNIRRK